MAAPPDLDELARRYLDLWQEHLSTLATDDEVAETVAKSIELMNGSAAAFARMAEFSSKEPRENTDDQGHPGNVTETPRATSAGAASGNSDDVVDQLTRRIGELEGRIAKLESEAGGGGKPA